MKTNRGIETLLSHNAEGYHIELFTQVETSLLKQTPDLIINKLASAAAEVLIKESLDEIIAMCDLNNKEFRSKLSDEIVRIIAERAVAGLVGKKNTLSV